MEEKTVYSAREFCRHHRIEITFVHSLQEYGLLAVEEKDDDLILSQEQLEALEKLVRLHFDLNINLEGIDVIYHLLNKMEGLHQEVLTLRSRLRLYENDF